MIKLAFYQFPRSFLGGFSGGTGAIISAVDTDVPTGPMIIVVAFLVVVISIGFAPERGLVWKLLRQSGDRKRFAAQTVMSDMFHYAYDHGSLETVVPQSFLIGLSGSVAKVGLQRLQSQGYVQKQNGGWELTTTGMAVASQQAQNALLWDVYRQYNESLNLPMIAEDRQQDIRKLLPESAIIKLKQQLEDNLI